MCGVYRIVNKVSGSIYVGSTVTPFAVRFSAHRASLEKGRHENDHLQNAFDRYGRDAFDFEVIERTSKEDALNREQYWLDYYKAKNVKLYNIAVKAGHPTAGRKLSRETRLRMSVGYPALVNVNTGQREPSGKSVTEFCRLHGLNSTVMASVVRGEKYSYRGWTVEGREKVNVCSYPTLVNRITGMIIEAGQNLNKVCDMYGLDRGTMSKVINGKREQHKGWTVA